MKQYNFSGLSAKELKQIAKVDDRGIAAYPWMDVEHLSDVAFQVSLNDLERRQVADITSRLLHHKTSLMNEATIWSRAIYPLLVLAEQEKIQAWVQVPLEVQYPHVRLQGTADGVLGYSRSGILETPYLIVVEAKRGLEASDPSSQLYGELLAAARLNWEQKLSQGTMDQQPQEEIFGCYTISDSWTFIRAVVEEIDSEEPKMTLESSREYVEKVEAETILKILKKIVRKYIDTYSQSNKVAL